MCTGFHIKYPLFLSDFNETSSLSTNFRKIRIIFNENQSCGSRVDYAEEVKDITELKVVFPYFANVPEKYDIIASSRTTQHVESQYPVHRPYFVEHVYTRTILYELLFITNNKTLGPTIFPLL